MSPSPLSPRLLKGAIVAIDPITSKETRIPFQYNPEKLTRTLAPRQKSQVEEGGQRAVALRFWGAPTEEFTSMEIHLDASDALENGDATAGSHGIYPQLSALEMLVYPSIQQVMDNDKLLGQGKMELAGGYEAPLALLVWGAQRVLPVQVKSITINETIFDTQLNPIQATVTLSMSALSYSDLAPSHKGYRLFLAYQKNKEDQASKSVMGGL